MMPPSRRYLLVDDNRALAENLAEILRDETGAEVSVAVRGADALALAKETRFDALLTDLRMPSMGGAELVHQLRSVDPGLPAVAFTAYSGEPDLAIARAEGLLAVLGKPVPVARLLELLLHARRDGLVVMVEDDAALADNLSEALRTRGFAAVTAVSLEETGRIAGVTPFAALVDLAVPGGRRGAAMARLLERFPALPVIVITAYDDAPPFPPVAVFRKPFDTQALLATLEKLWQAARA